MQPSSARKAREDTSELVIASADTGWLLMPPTQVIVMARKPDFFSYNMSLYEVVTPDGLMKPVLAAKRGGLYCGGRWGDTGVTPG